MHGLIFFYIRKFADVVSSDTASWSVLRSTVATSHERYLPSGTYPDSEAVELLTSLAETANKPLPAIIEQFGMFLAPHLLKVAGQYVDPDWSALDLIEHTESIIHSMIRSTNPGAEPPVLDTARESPAELTIIYSSQRRLCGLAKGLIRGIGKHYKQELNINETCCMHKGSPFCTLVVTTENSDTQEKTALLHDTIEFNKEEAEILENSSSQAAPSPEPYQHTRPSQIGEYQILNDIGRGGMGKVFLGHDEQLQREVAIKVMHSHRAHNQAARKRFLNESRATAAIDHPHVVTIHQVGEHDGVPFIVMQRLEGCTLQEYCTESGSLSVSEVLRIGREVALGLEAAHSHGLVHRDIKPANIILEGPNKHVKIIDFGLALDTLESSSKLTDDGSIVGTPAYMSPERVNGDTIDSQSDIFSLGIILYEMLSGKLPFEGESIVSTLVAIAGGRAEPLHKTATDIPELVSSFIMQMIAPNKADRPATASIVVNTILEIEKQLNSHA